MVAEGPGAVAAKFTSCGIASPRTCSLRAGRCQELKEDSVIFDDSGNPKIVDAGMVSRVSNRLLKYVDAILDGRINPDEYEDHSTLAFYVRREFGQKPPMDEEHARRLLERLYALGARRD